MNVLVISADQFEDSELIEPVKAINDAGHHTDVASLESGTITGKKGTKVNANLTVDEVNPDDYELLLLPGGKAPAKLRTSAAVLSIAHKFMQQQKPVAAICHGPQILISADLVKGRRMTCYQSVADELKAAGAEYEDQPLVVDENLISSRQPDDLPVFTSAILEQLQQIAAKQPAEHA